MTCFTNAPEDVSPALREHLRVRPLDAVTDAPSVLPVYHVGNHAVFHAGILCTALRRPGVLVLHELVLYDLVERLLLGNGQRASFAEWVRAAEPEAPAPRVRAAVRGRLDPHLLPLCEPLVRASRLTMVYNEWAREELQRRCPAADVIAVPQHCVPPPANTADTETLRAQYRLPAAGMIVGSFGHQTPAKRLDVALAAFAQLHREHSDTAYIFAGPASARVDVRALAARQGVADAVHCFGFVSEPMWWDLLACTDLCVSLRGPTQGETSASLLKQCSVGKAVCVSAAGPDLAFPADAVCHIPQADDEVDQLAAAMRRAATDPAWRTQLGRAAQVYVREHHSLAASADAILAACARAESAPVPHDRFDIDRALHQTRGFAAVWHAGWYRARVARNVGRRHGWGAVAQGVRARVTPPAARNESHAHLH